METTTATMTTTTTEQLLADVEETPFDEALVYTPEEYLRRERTAFDRHEFHNGRIYAMPGASKKHNIIAYNVNKALVKKLPDDYFVFGSDMRVHNPVSGRYVYPDLTIVKEDFMRFADDREDVLLTPMVIIEILSKSTEQYDRTEKFDAYKGIESLQEYVLVSQRAPHIEIFTRKNRLEWLYAERFALDDDILLYSIEFSLHLADVYAKVNFGSDS
jgi:Uma2 family endonuclease